MDILLARHGNTFQSNQSVVWVGSQNDLPLVASGIEQAILLGKVLLEKNFIPTSVYTGPLQRMTSYANLIMQQLNIRKNLIVDARLNEIDYGKWSGLTTKQVCEQFGTEEYHNWENDSQWPSKGEWGESASLVAQRIQNIVQEIVAHHREEDKILIVASNGCLRYFLKLTPNAFETQIANHSIKIATGNVSKLSYHAGTWVLDCWNVSPAQCLGA